jgi:hypothetical protein
MLQEKETHTPSKRTLLSAVSALVLLGAVAALGTTTNGGGLRAAGLMPEVVCTASRPRLIMNEVIVRASRPNLAAVVRLSGINK